MQSGRTGCFSRIRALDNEFAGHRSTQTATLTPPQLKLKVNEIMKSQQIIRYVLALVLPVSITLSASPIGPAFTYQGRLQDTSGPVNGPYDLEFRLFDDSSAGNQIGVVTKSQTVVSNGLFVVTLDFGAGAFTGQARWLQIGVRAHASDPFTVVGPRQEMTPTPYALFAPTAATANSVAPLAVNSSSIADNTITSVKIASGQVVKSLNGLADAVTLSAGANVTLATDGNGLRISATPGTIVTNAGWGLSGNSNTTTNNFLGTTDGQSLDVRVNNARAMRWEPGAASGPNVIGGYKGNTVRQGVSGATIAGGGAAIFVTPFLTFYEPNIVGSDYGTIGGGVDNQALGLAGVVAGGKYNVAIADYASMAGGERNGVETGADHAAHGGGQTNIIKTGAHHAVLGGGLDNQVSGYLGTLGGGTHNRVSGPGGTIPGGNGNEAAGFNTFAAGTQAHAAHDGAFVWADNHYLDFASTAPNQFLVRASGGMGINTTSPQGMLHIEGDSSLSYAHLLLHETQADDFARLRLKAGVHSAWDIAAGGPNDDLNFYRSDLGDLMTLTTTAFQVGLSYTTLTLRQPTTGVLIQRFQGKVGEWSENVETASPGGTFSLNCNGYTTARFDGASASSKGGVTIPGYLSAGGTGSFQDLLVAGGSVMNGSLSLGHLYDQHLTMGDWCGMGSQPGICYFRSGPTLDRGNGFAWFLGGSHSDNSNDPGTGGIVLMKLSYHTEIGAECGGKFCGGEGGADAYLQVNGDLNANGFIQACCFHDSSDRNIKRDFAPVEAPDILNKVLMLPITTWRYTNSVDRHIGPMAQDFSAAFQVGMDDKHIATVDGNGVALAAIQGLNQKLEEKNAALEKEVAELKVLVNSLALKVNGGGQ
jgi:hypothetical protein